VRGHLYPPDKIVNGGLVVFKDKGLVHRMTRRIEDRNRTPQSGDRDVTTYLVSTGVYRAG
jgi:hypothetical protein